MPASINKLAAALTLAAGLCLLPGHLAAQGKSKQYTVTTDRAITVTREVLGKQGFEVVRIARDGDNQIVYYRRGNQGKGKGKGKLEKMIVRREANRVVFVDTPAAVLTDIDVRLRF
jgi:hypothetical protein